MTTAFLTNWIYVAVFIAAGAAMVVGILLMSRLVYPIHPSPEKYSTYECGIEPVGDSWHPFAVRYHIFALLFLVFDVEAIFLFPWAVTFRRLGLGRFRRGAGVHRRPRRRPALRLAQRGARVGLTDDVGLRSFTDRIHYPNISQFERPNVVTTTVDFIFSWARSHSVFPFTYGLACCAIEMLSSGFARFDVARYGMEVFRPTPRQCDLMIVAGTVNEKMAPVLKRLYEQMSEPKWVIAMGACATSGGPFYDGYNVVNGVDKVVPVDVYIPGCPPRPEALFQGLLELQKKIQAMRIVPPVPGDDSAAASSRAAVQQSAACLSESVAELSQPAATRSEPRPAGLPCRPRNPTMRPPAAPTISRRSGASGAARDRLGRPFDRRRRRAPGRRLRRRPSRPPRAGTRHGRRCGRPRSTARRCDAPARARRTVV